MPVIIDGKEEYSKAEIKSLELLKDKDFFEKIITELDKEIVKEKPARRVLLLCTSGKLVLNADHTSYNLLVEDETGAGKDHLCKSIGKLYVPEVSFVHRTRISPKTLNYWDMNWENKTLYLEDIGYNVLNCEVMRTFLSSGSHVTLLKDQKIIEKEILEKPVVLFTVASINPKDDMLRRINILNLDTTINQTKAIAKRKCRLAGSGIHEEIDPIFIKALNKLKRIKVKIPFYKKLISWIERIPDENIRVLFRTQIQTILDYIKSSTALHQFQREQDEDGFYLAVKQDYEIGRRCYNKMITTPTMIPLTKNLQKIVKEIKQLQKDLNKEWIDFIELQKVVVFLSIDGLRKALHKLVSYKILIKDFEKRDDIKKPISVFKIMELKGVKLPQFDKL